MRAVILLAGSRKSKRFAASLFVATSGPVCSSTSSATSATSAIFLSVAHYHTARLCLND